MQLVVLKRALWLELDVAGRNLAFTEVFSLCTDSKIFQAIVRSVALDGGETWAVKEEDLAYLDINDMIVQWVCNVTQKRYSMTWLRRE